ncbi:hypothetical protein ACIQBJ_33095 [Kitasatospora sp. NPDC088391]|uniref:hypothetical protein n=1 Tax=Kitasatospora sp. NPDC088391 TaxID=3364074 RepID=UPI00382A999B
MTVRTRIRTYARTHTRARVRVRAAIVALGVAASSLTIATVGASSAHACGLSALGPVQQINSPSGSLGQFYFAWNSCTAQAYAEVHFTAGTYGNGQIALLNNAGTGTANSGPQGSWWESPMLSIYSNPSSERHYYGVMSFTANGHSCEGRTPTWNFSDGSYDTSRAYTRCWY